jgi:hypothetical protein
MHLKSEHENGLSVKKCMADEKKYANEIIHVEEYIGRYQLLRDIFRRSRMLEDAGCYIVSNKEWLISTMVIW